MYRHVVMFRFTSESTEAQRDAAIEALRALPQTIGDIRTLVVAGNVGTGPANYDLVLEATFDDDAGFGRYGVAESHQRAWKTMLQPIVTDMAGIQFEVPAD